MKVIGLTGGIGSGKTTVANYLSQLGAHLIDADLVAREIVAPGSPALQEIITFFGPQVLNSDGTLNRQELASLVFSQETNLKKLNNITHPRITTVISERIATYHQSFPHNMIVLVAPLLIEVGLHQMVDWVWVVHVNPEDQIQRIIKRDNLSAIEALKRIKAQITEEKRLSFADEVINNSGNWQETKSKIEALWHKYTNKL